MRPNQLRNRLALMAFGAIITGATLGTGIAKADGFISDTEFAYVSTYGASAVCPVIDEYPFEAGVMGVAAGIIEDGFAPDSAVDIINASVSAFCPQHWPLLVEIGAKARGEIIPKRVI